MKFQENCYENIKFEIWKISTHKVYLIDSRSTLLDAQETILIKLLRQRKKRKDHPPASYLMNISSMKLMLTGIGNFN